MITIIDYKSGNLRSIHNGFTKIGYEAEITSDPERIGNADFLVLPGVGAFGSVMDNIEPFKDVIYEHINDDKPFLGICLGHQVIAEVFESIVSYAKEVVHGKAFKLKIMENSPLFKGIDKEFMGARYHSLAIKRETLGEDLKIIATTDDGEIMAIEHRRYPIYGLQFHPESILSDNGKKLIQNFLDIRGGQNDKTSNISIEQ